jgi:hypothetical protein
MARQELRLTIEDEGRDQGKIYVLTEMPARQAEKWAGKALTALTRAGAELPDDVLTAGMAGLAMMGVQALSEIRWEDVEPLMDEMFECIQIQPDPTKPTVVRKLVEDDIEEVLTLFRLRKEILSLHVRPIVAAAPSKSARPGTAAPLATGVITRTSPVQ